MTRFIATTLIASGLTASLLGGCGLQFGTKKEDDKPSSPSMGGAGGAPADTAMGGETGMGGEMATEPEPCEPRPDELDVPDDDFNDSNCDGIDGTIARAIFVSPNGSDDGEGTMDDPVATIQEGIARGAETRRAVYVCNATYEEKVRVESDSADVFGGYDCEDWRRSTDRPTIFSNDGEPALIVANVDDMLIDGFVIQSSDATEPRGSSIAAAVNNSEGVVFKNVEIVAGGGADGADGSDGSGYSSRARKGDDGDLSIESLECSNCFGRGGTGGSAIACEDGSTARQGGSGGNGADWDGSPTWTNGRTAGFNDGAGGDGLGANGEPGDSGDLGAPGAISSQSIGALEGLTYLIAENGADGQYGRPGRSGGGGAGSDHLRGQFFEVGGHGGGQGGSAGCGGRPGTAGSAGGASIALLVVESELELRATHIVTSAGGAGGDGGLGGAGQRGGQKGFGASTAGDGGDGGDGGEGGDGAPGNGGPTIGIASQGGFLPLRNRVTYDLGQGGLGGEGGEAPNIFTGLQPEPLETYEFVTE